MPPGRPPKPGTAEQRAAARRQKVRANVQAFRRRQRESSQINSSSGNSSSAIIEDNLSVPGPPVTTYAASTAVATTLSPQASLTVPIDEAEKPWTVNLPFRFDMESAYTAAFIEAFLHRSDPSTNILATNNNEVVRVEVCCSDWVTSVTFEAQSPGSEMLQDALAAAALNLLSIEQQDPRLSEHALTVNSRGLRRLREAFTKFINDRASGNPSLIYATIMTLSVSELLVNKSWENFEKHMLGIGALIQYEGPGALLSKAARDNFYGYRSIQIPFSFIRRRGSFLAKKEWIEFSWRNQHESNNPFHTLLDIAFQIPVEMERYDDATQKTPLNLAAQLERMSEITLKLEHWMTVLYEMCSSSIYTTEPAAWGGLHDSAIKFCNADVASAYTYFAGIKTALCNLVRDIVDELNEYGDLEPTLLQNAVQESLKWSRIVFQCLEYFFAQDRKVFGKLICLFPFDVAWETVEVLSTKYRMDMRRELLWCEVTAKRLVDAGLPLLKNRTAGFV